MGLVLGVLVGIGLLGIFPADTAALSAFTHSAGRARGSGDQVGKGADQAVHKNRALSDKKRLYTRSWIITWRAQCRVVRPIVSGTTEEVVHRMIPFLIPSGGEPALHVMRMVVRYGGGGRGQNTGHLECTDDKGEKHVERAQEAVGEHVADKSRQ